MTILETINEIYPKLTKKQKLIADFMQANMDTMTFVTLKDLSRELNISEITVLNMCKALGYSSFNEVKDEFRKCIGYSRKEFYQNGEYYHHTDYSDVAQYIRKEQNLLDTAKAELSLLQDLVDKTDCSKLFKAAEMILAHPKIILCGRGISYMLCEHLRTMLAVLQISCMLINTELNDEIYSVLPAIDKKTLVVAASFPDYYYVTEKMAAYASKRGASVITVTDREDSDITEFADLVLTAGSRTSFAPNTLSAPMALMNLLYTAIYLTKNQQDGVSSDDFGTVF